MREFNKYHPAALLLYFAAVTLPPMFIINPIIQGISLLGAVLFSLTFSEKKELRRGAVSFFVLFILITLTNPLISHNGVTALLFINGSAITLESLLCGAGNALMIIAVILWFCIFSRIMTGDKWLAITGKRLPRTTLILIMSLRLVPLFSRRLKKVSGAQKALGLYAPNNYTDKLKGGAGVFSALVTWSLENAAVTSFSMDARGYGLPGRTQYAVYTFHPRDAVLLFVTALFAGVMLSAAAGGAAYFAYYPAVTTAPLSALTAAVYLPYAALTLIPLLWECKERIHWKYCVSKI